MFKHIVAVLVVCWCALPNVTAEIEAGLLARFYELDGHAYQMPELAPNQLPNAVKIVPTPELRSDRGDFKPFEDDFYVEIEGFLTIDKPGAYVFRLMSDDGSMLWIDGRLAIDHDGLHGIESKIVKIELAAGRHTLRINYFEYGGDEHLELRWLPAGTSGDFTPIPAAALTHDKTAARETAPGKKRMIPPLRRGLPGDGTPVAGMHPGFKIEGDSPGPSHDQGLTVNQGFICKRDSRNEEAGNPIAWVSKDLKYDADSFVYDLAAQAYDGQKLAYAPSEVKRIVLDTVDGVAQGCSFRFSAAKSPLHSLAAGGTTAFEMLAVRALSNGFEIEFTKPLDKRCGWEPETYYVEQWPFDVTKCKPPQRDGVEYPVKSATVSPDRRKIFLELENLKPAHVVYLRMLPPCYSEEGEKLWSTEAWYTLNVIPTDREGEVIEPPACEPQNVLTAQEQADGWELLFDGKSGKGWHGYRKDFFPEGWKVKDGRLVRCGPAGDISTDGEYANFELAFEWRVSAAANSGVFYRVNEEFDWPFFSGPEYQILDNAEHADGRNPKTSAASNYALHAPSRDATAPVGYFNHARLVVNGPHVEHWLNGEKVVEYELWTDEWKAMVAEGKFNAWKHYGLMNKGHIVIQDHGDMVWFRNIKIRRLPD